MKSGLSLGLLVASLLIAVVMVPPGLANPSPLHASAVLGVSLSFSPNPVGQNSATTGSYSITSGTGPYTIWQNGTPPGCNPQNNPMVTSSPSGTFPCTPTATGNFPIHVDVHDSAGNSGSTQVTLIVNSGSGGSGGSGTGGNNTGGIDLSFLQNLLPVLMITGIVFLGSVVAIAASAVALAILVPRRLKQIRKALEGQPMVQPKAETPATPPKEQPPSEPL